MTAPVIGITCYRERAAFGIWDTTVDLLHAQYADAVAHAGGVGVLLPAATGVEAAAAVVARLDGLVIAGGADVDPTSYGEEPHALAQDPRPERDAWEFALLEAAEAAGLPVLGVCRGMQVMAVHAGGRLDQHTPDLVGHDRHSPGGDEFGTTQVRTAPGSVAARVLGESAEGPCHHHQSVASHPGFTPTAWASDGTLEAMELPGDRFCVAVQWHPEMGRDQRLFDALVSAASSPR